MVNRFHPLGYKQSINFTWDGLKRLCCFLWGAKGFRGHLSYIINFWCYFFKFCRILLNSFYSGEKRKTTKKNPNPPKNQQNPQTRNYYLVLFMHQDARISVPNVAELGLLSHCSALLSKACPPPSLPYCSNSDCIWQGNWVSWQPYYIHAAT